MSKKHGKQVSDSVCFITCSTGTQRGNICLLNHGTLKSHGVMYRRTSRHMQGNSTTTVPLTRDGETFVRDDKILRQNFSVTLQSDDHWRYGYSIRLNRTILHNYLRYAVQLFPINWQPKSTFRFNYKTKSHTSCGRDSTVSKGLYGPGSESRRGGDFSVPEARPESRTMAIASLSRE